MYSSIRHNWRPCPSASRRGDVSVSMVSTWQNHNRHTWYPLAHGPGPCAVANRTINKVVLAGLYCLVNVITWMAYALGHCIQCNVFSLCTRAMWRFKKRCWVNVFPHCWHLYASLFGVDDVAAAAAAAAADDDWGRPRFCFGGAKTAVSLSEQSEL